MLILLGKYLEILFGGTAMNVHLTGRKMKLPTVALGFAAVFLAANVASADVHFTANFSGNLGSSSNIRAPFNALGGFSSGMEFTGNLVPAGGSFFPGGRHE
jgi:hypothetical protein